MADSPPSAAHDAWKAWLRARFGDRLSGTALEAAAADCEALRALWAPLLEAPEANGELPFSNVLPGIAGTDGAEPT